MTNPVRALRERLGLSRRELALRSGLGYGQVAALELGYPRRLPPAALRALAELGADPAELARAYETWRAQHQQRQKAAV